MATSVSVFTLFGAVPYSAPPWHRALEARTIRNLLITPQSSRRLCFCSPGAWADEDAEEPDTSEPRAEPSKEQPSEAGRASFFNALCLTIGGDITRLSGLQIGMALVEPTVILQA